MISFLWVCTMYFICGLSSHFYSFFETFIQCVLLVFIPSSTFPRSIPTSLPIFVLFSFLFLTIKKTCCSLILLNVWSCTRGLSAPKATLLQKTDSSPYSNCQLQQLHVQGQCLPTVHAEILSDLSYSILYISFIVQVHLKIKYKYCKTFFHWVTHLYFCKGSFEMEEN